MFSSQSFQGSIPIDAWKQPLAAGGSPAVSFGFSQSSSHNLPAFARAPNQAIQQGGFGGFAAAGTGGFSFAMAAQQTNSSLYASGGEKTVSTPASFGPGPAVGQAFGGQAAFGAFAAGGAAFSGQGFGVPAGGGQAAFGGQSSFVSPVAGSLPFVGQGFGAPAAGGQLGKFSAGVTPLALNPTDFGRVAPQGEDSD
jgi:hypothetical protein